MEIEMNFERTILVTGGAGFIGSHLVRLLVKKYPSYLIINYDKLTYAGNLENLNDIRCFPNYKFIKGDICDKSYLEKVFSEYSVDGVIHLAAESHVDRSIRNPLEFANTNVIGTLTLLQVANDYWQKEFEGKLFYHVSTDEVYGTLELGEHPFEETNSYGPRSPYSASKASSDHFVRAFYQTYGLPIVISNCSNNYGPNQFPEKLIPLVINNIKRNYQIPVYGRGENIRDWLYVEDHADAIDLIFHKATVGSTYNIGGLNERKNIDVVKKLVEVTERLLNRPIEDGLNLITYVKDRAGHDLRYAIDSSKLQNELGWKPKTSFDEGIEKTVRWYMENEQWLLNVTSGAYVKYYNEYYG